MNRKNKIISLLLSLILFNIDGVNANEKEISKLETVQTTDSSENNIEKTKIIINNISQKNAVPEVQKIERKSVALGIVTTIVNGITKTIVYTVVACAIVFCVGIIASVAKYR